MEEAALDRDVRSPCPMAPSRYLRTLKLDCGWLLYNSLWPSPVRVSKDVLQLLRQLGSHEAAVPPPDAIAQCLHQLEEHRIVFHDPSAEHTLLESEHQAWLARAARGELIRTLVLDVDTRCNMRCTYCNVLKAQAEGYLGPPAPMPWTIAGAASNSSPRCSRPLGAAWFSSAVSPCSTPPWSSRPPVTCVRFPAEINCTSRSTPTAS
jgi:hypothetical protein